MKSPYASILAVAIGLLSFCNSSYGSCTIEVDGLKFMCVEYVGDDWKASSSRKTNCTAGKNQAIAELEDEGVSAVVKAKSSDAACDMDAENGFCIESEDKGSEVEIYFTDKLSKSDVKDICKSDKGNYYE